jgi:uncharacterized surface protein with fasciclin (FAS1) repeats
MLSKGWVAAACALVAGCGDGGEGNEASAPAPSDARPAAAAAAPAPAGGTILDALSSSADHKTLANAVRAAGLTETLSGAQPYTLFAPTDAAFRALPAGTMSTLLAPDSKGHLTAMITNHIVPGTVTAADLGRAMERGSGKASLATVGGTSLSLGRDGEVITVAEAGGGRGRIVRADLAQSNGVVHAIDAVLLPAPAPAH